MAANASEHTPIRGPRADSLIHAFALRKPGKTACGQRCRGWTIALLSISCEKCLRKIAEERALR